MEDITPSLIQKVRDDFFDGLNNNKKVNTLYEKVRKGTASYDDANQFAVEVGNMLSKAFKLNISSDNLPDGKMYYNIAERLMSELLGDEHKIVSEMAASVQELANLEYGIGVKAIVPKINEDRVKGFIERLSSGEAFDDIAWILGEPVVNFAQSTATDTLYENSKFLDGLGVQVTIVRELGDGFHDKTCDWCRSLAGVYRYEDVSNSGNEVYMRHDNCRCRLKNNLGYMKISGHAFVRH